MEHFILILTESNLFIQGLCVLLSVFGLWIGSEKTIWGVKNFARKFGISEMLIGLSVVSIGSSLPEIFVNISAGLKGVDDIGVGNVVGSCFVQISCILGICVLVAGAMHEKRKILKRDAPVLLGSIVLLFLFGLNGVISVFESLILMGGYIAYLIYLFKTSKGEKIKKRKAKSKMFLWILAFLLGVFFVWFSAEILLGIGIATSEKLGISNGVIGLLSGIGTSIPELSISLMALLKKSNGISVGNILGSNITDPLLSLGIGAFLAGGYQVSDFLLFTAIPIWFLGSFLAILVFWFTGKMTRIPALYLVGFYFMSFYFFFL